MTRTPSPLAGALAACALFAAPMVDLATIGPAWAAKGTKMWNLTDNTVTKLQLAPAGTDRYGPDQAKNDKDGAVDHDERLKITDVATGSYDIKLSDAKGRTCTAKNVAVTEGEVFSIEEKQLSCGK